MLCARAPPPRRIVARLSRARLIAAGATAVALASSACGDSEPTISPFYGIAIGDYDAGPDASFDGAPHLDASDGSADTSVDAAPILDAADGSLDAGPPMVDASDGAPPLDSGSDADDGD